MINVTFNVIETLTNKVVENYFNSTEYKNTFGVNKAKIKIKNNIETIDEHAFFKCEKIEAIDLPSKLHEKGIEAFSECKALKTIYIPESVIENTSWRIFRLYIT